MEEENKRRWHEPKPGTRDNAEKTYIMAEDLRILVATQLKNKISCSFSLHIADDEYYCPPMSDAKEVIEESKLDRKKWAGRRFDCDDFAFVLKAHFAEASYAHSERRAAHCFGIIWGHTPDEHAINWVVTDEMKLYFVEPQTDDVCVPDDTDNENIWLMIV